MRTIEFNGKTNENFLKWNSAIVDVSYDMWQDIREDAIRRYRYKTEEYIEKGAMSCLEMVLNNISDHLKREGYLFSDNIRMLNAHGANCQTAGWIYCDLEPGNERTYSIQEWIRKHEKNHDVLFVNSCNPGNAVLPTSRSTIIYPKGITDSNAVRRELYKGDTDAFSIVCPLKAG